MNDRGVPPKAGQLQALVLAAGVVLVSCSSVQRVDPHFRPSVPAPRYEPGTGPVVWIDHGHFNVVNLSHRYDPLLEVLRADGYRLRTLRSVLVDDLLDEVGILIIGNPLSGPASETALAPSRPAFTPREVDAILKWVQAGGRLLLLLDHMPFAGAGEDLSRRLGFEISDGFVIDPSEWGPTVFRRTDQTLLDHSVTRGRFASERVSSAAAFHGAAFQVDHGKPFLLVPDGFVSFMPKTPWDIDGATPQLDVQGWAMAASREIGDGRVLVFSDATMFSAQIAKDGSMMGMNSPTGSRNQQLLLNALHWLDGTLD